MSHPTRTRGRGLAALAIAATLALAACNQSSTPAGGSGPTIADYAFSPGSITVPVNGTVMWTNNAAQAHTVTADDGSFDSHDIAGGAVFSHTFSAAGTFTYHCTIHPQMKATVVVTP